MNGRQLKSLRSLYISQEKSRRLLPEDALPQPMDAIKISLTKQMGRIAREGNITASNEMGEMLFFVTRAKDEEYLEKVLEVTENDKRPTKGAIAKATELGLISGQGENKHPSAK